MGGTARRRKQILERAGAGDRAGPRSKVGKKSAKAAHGETGEDTADRLTTGRDLPAIALDGNEEMRRPLTALAILVPLGLFAEIYRFLSEAKASLLTEQQWGDLGAPYGLQGGLVLLGLLGLGCLTVHLCRRLPWELPGPWLMLQILLWAALWAVVRYTVSFTNEAVQGRHIIQEGVERLDAFAQLGYGFAGALQEETVFRAGLLGLGVLIANAFVNAREVLIWAVVLPLVSILFALAHTDVINHTAGADPFTWPTFIRHLLGGLIYGMVFIRQGLVVAVLAHFGYNCALLFQLGPW